MDAKAAKKKAKNERREQEKTQLKIYREQLITLAKDEKRSQLAFPPTLDSGQRKKLHTYAHGLGLKSKSHGKGEGRFLIVYKRDTMPFVPINDNTTRLTLSENSIEKIGEFLEKDPLNDIERQTTILRPNDSKSQAHLPFMFGDSRSKTKVTVPPLTNGTEQFTTVRQSLPIFEYRDGILSAINQHQVVVISGETGSGKTTQVPQYIMEEFAVQNRECRIICTQPRRLAATSIATRISQERNDTLGKSVGYQIRLDSRITPTTNLVFTTSGYLLRCLTGSKQEDVYKSITHLIIDEVHEREKVTDFLLIAIRDAIQVNKKLKVILMSATIDSELFSSYFDNCPVINVPGRMFDVEIMHLGDVLMETGYKSNKMTVYMSENQAPKILRASQSTAAKNDDTSESAEMDIAEEDIQFYDECFDECLNQNDDTTFEQIFLNISDENMPVDYLHSTLFRTALGIAGEKGFDDVVTKLLAHGADPNLVDPHGKTAFDYAEENEQEECCEILLHHQQFAPVNTAITEDKDDEARARALQQYTLAAYQMTGMTDIDHELLHHVILHIHNGKPIDGSILVFLPGFEDIMTQKDLIEQRFQGNNYQLFVLHSGVNGTNSAEQTRVFDRMPQGIRKIILSTNIAETSLTINDVVYVVDAGKVKQLSYDSISESTCLKSTSISQACAKQRAGRAGRIRNGFCYRLYSQEHYDSMEKYTLPEILRVPLTEICLNAKMLAGDLSIEDFLLKALQPPSVKNIRQSIGLLKKISALDDDEHITYLGIHLANMPVDCQYGKMILYAILMRCLDPVVTIISALSVKDPFMLPLGNEGEKISQIKKKFARGSMSDHQMLLNAYDEWTKQKKRAEFCQENFISNGNMFMIQGVRRLIMGHLKMAQLVTEDTARNIRKVNLNSLNWEIVKACLTAGMYPNLCRITSLSGQIFSKQDKKLLPHLSSVLRQRKTRGQVDPEIMKIDAEWLIHGEKSRISSFSLIRNITVVPAIDVILFTGPISLPPDSVSLAYVPKVELLSDMDCDDIPDEDDILTTDLDDGLFTSDRDAEQDSVLKVDDWISFTLEQEEAKLLFDFRQKFASMFARFAKDSVTFQMTNKEERMLQILIEVIHEEDRIEKCIKAKLASKESDEDEGSEAVIESPVWEGRNNRRQILEMPAGPAYASAAYNQAIQPEHRRNKKKPNQNRGKGGKRKFERSSPVNWRNRETEQNTSPFSNIHHWRNMESEQNNSRFTNLPNWRDMDTNQSSSPFFNNIPEWRSPSQPSTSYANAQQQLTQGLFNSDNLAPSTVDGQQNLDIGTLNLGPATAIGLTEGIPNRYFVMTARNVGHLYASAFQHVWLFNTPLTKMREIARESEPRKVILLFLNQKKSAIFGFGEFHARSSGQYDISVDKNIRRFRPLYEMDASDDYEMESNEGHAVYNICLNMAKNKQY